MLMYFSTILSLQHQASGIVLLGNNKSQYSIVVSDSDTATVLLLLGTQGHCEQAGLSEPELAGISQDATYDAHRGVPSVPCGQTL